MTGKTIVELAVGHRAEVSRRVEATDVAAFVALVGDDNPIHRDAAFAAATPFKEPIAPGILTAAFISAVIGSALPGPGTIYLSQSVRFLKPVWIGDTITAAVEVRELLPSRNRVLLRTVCTNQHGEPVLEGEAWVMPPKAVDARRLPQGASGQPLPLAA